MINPPIRIDLPLWFIYMGLFILGANIGSFLNVCILRIPTRERFFDQLRTLWERPSQCPRCGQGIRWHDNIPILGWIMLRGRCRKCQMRISPRYPMIEFLNAMLWVIVFWLEVPTGFSASLDMSCLYTNLGPQNYPGLGEMSAEGFVLWRYLYHMILIEALLVATFIDFDLRIIPDGSTLPAMLTGIVASTVLARMHLVPVYFQTDNHLASYQSITPAWMHSWLAGPAVPEWISLHPHLHGLVVSLAGLIVGGGIVWLVRIIGFWMLRQEAMGFGDVILMAMIGAFLGWQASILAFFIAPLCAIAVLVCTTIITFIQRCLGQKKNYDHMIPYGPYLSLGALITLLAWKPLFQASRHVFEMGFLLIPVALAMTCLFGACLLFVQGIKKVLGIRDLPLPAMGVWRAADQNCYQKGEHIDRHTGRWRTQDWDGCASGHGTIHEERWRHPQQNRGWKFERDR